MSDLLTDLEQGEREANIDGACPLCEYIASQDDPDTKAVLTRAAAGTIGRDKLAAILKAHGTGIGQRTIRRHRSERHGS
jgi:hypothetical protein